MIFIEKLSNEWADNEEYWLVFYFVQMISSIIPYYILYE